MISGRGLEFDSGRDRLKSEAVGLWGRMSQLGDLERFAVSSVNARFPIGQGTSAGACSGDGLAPTPAVHETMIIWLESTKPTVADPTSWPQ
jgi:hypothetical protein